MFDFGTVACQASLSMGLPRQEPQAEPLVAGTHANTPRGRLLSQLLPRECPPRMPSSLPVRGPHLPAPSRDGERLL